MNLAVAFTLFIASVVLTLYYNYPISLAMTAGFILFFMAGFHRGYSVRDLLAMSLKGAKDSLIVVRVLLTIGVLTGLWRSAGTFAILVSLGLKAITPSMFILAAFILPCVLSYALGTSFGTAGTLGVALMTLARSGGADPIITAGAVMSGIHFGDRGSPSSSCLHLVTALTGTEIYSNVRAMMKSALLPLAVSTVFYFVLSLRNPLVNFSSETLDELSSAFNLSYVAVSPAVIMLVLPMFRLNIFIAFVSSIIAALVISVMIQGYSISDALSVAIFGLHSDAGIKAIFNGTGMLDGLQEKLSAMIKRFGEYPVILSVGTMMNAIFCNQTVGVIMTVNLFRKPYSDNGISREDFVLDLSNSTVITAPLVPWCIACSVPLSMMGEGVKVIPYACYLYMIPITFLLTKKRPTPNRS
ncbi:MAG: sodium:proton antiporter [Synergistaceae bacterium]|nr:sodium:proton antiporter [Synergistaceae bacterium]